MKHVSVVFACLLAIGVASPAFAQGVQTATITGTVQSADGQSLPGVTITASSPALQGLRTAVTDVNGVYVRRGLPAGAYTISFDLSGFRPVKKENVALSVGGTVE